MLMCRISALISLALVTIACGSVSGDPDAGDNPDAGTGSDAPVAAATVTNVTSDTADGAYTAPTEIVIAVTFSEPVTVTGTPQLTLNSGAPAIDYTGGSGTDTLTFGYTIAAGEASDDLDYVDATALTLNGGAIAGAGGDADLTLADPGDEGSLGYNKAIVVDAVAPVVESVSSQTPDGTYGEGSVIVVDVVFSEPVTVTGTPQLALNAGDPPVDYASGTGSATLSFSYTVGSGASSSDLDYLDAAALTLNGGMIRDDVGNDADLTLPAPGAAGSLSFDHDLVILTACNWDISLLPSQDVHMSNYFGEIAFADDCDILAMGAWATDDVYRVSRIDGTVTTFSTLAGAGGLLGIVHRPADGYVYVASDGPNQLWRIDGAGNGTMVMDLPELITSLAVAPAGFGAYGGMLFGAGHDGNVYVIDPSVPSATAVGTTTGILSDLVFAPDGSVLYIANNTNASIQTMTSAGVFDDFLTGLSGVDGLAIDTDGSRLFVAHFPSGARVDEVSIPGGVLTAGQAIALDGGWYTSGILADADDDVCVKTQDTNAKIGGLSF